ncbi:MAG TPA: hypothetical protein VF041_23135 [Gemmatimonadaceae bacterium]
MEPWTQLFVRNPHVGGYSGRQAMRRVDEHLQQLGALMHVPPGGDGLPVPEPDGTYEVRAFGDPGFVRYVLEQHYGLAIEREETHDE